MEKYIQKLLIVLFPFYPIWGAIFSTFTHQKIDSFINFLWIPIVIYYLLTKANKLPKYLLFLILFTIFHLVSIYLNNLATTNSSFFLTVLFDSNVLACAVLFIVENTKFDDRFISIMNRNILIIIAVSLFVSLIQVKIPSFFASPELTDTEENLVYLDQGRAFSIYSWININSLGITFPFLISILLNVYNIKKKSFSLVVISGLIVSFLSRARYVMISAIIVFSQLFISSKITLRNKVISVFVVAISIIVLLTIAENSGFSIQKVIDERILEKEGEMGSANARITSYYVFLMKFPENPWFGVGPATREDVIELLGGEAPLIHVGYLSYLYFYGVFGFFILFLSMAFLLKDAFIIGKKYLFWGSFYGLIAYFMANTTTVYFNFSEMGIILAVIYLKYYKDQSELDLPENNGLAPVG